MAEYIEREALRKMFIEHFDAIYATDGRLIFSDHVCVGEDCEDILKLVDDMPTADVVSEERCREIAQEMIPHFVRHARTVAIKEFAERLKEKAYIPNSRFGISEEKEIHERDVDNLVKEMVGDTE